MARLAQGPTPRILRRIEDRRVRALDATSGKVLWEQTIGGPIANSTITYSVNGQQYIAVRCRGRHHDSK
jgi:hypothetical protein